MSKLLTREALEKIITYHSDEGTSGYSLSTEQLENLIKAINDHTEAVIGEDEGDVESRVAGSWGFICNDLRAEQRERGKIT